MKSLIHLEEIIIMNVNMLCNTVSKYIKQNLQANEDKLTMHITLGNFGHVPLSVMNSSNREQIFQDI